MVGGQMGFGKMYWKLTFKRGFKHFLGVMFWVWIHAWINFVTAERPSAAEPRQRLLCLAALQWLGVDIRPHLQKCGKIRLWRKYWFYQYYFVLSQNSAHCHFFPWHWHLPHWSLPRPLMQPLQSLSRKKTTFRGWS